MWRVRVRATRSSSDEDAYFRLVALLSESFLCDLLFDL
jgi:hypothetical protein